MSDLLDELQQAGCQHCAEGNTFKLKKKAHEHDYRPVCVTCGGIQNLVAMDASLLQEPILQIAAERDALREQVRQLQNTISEIDRHIGHWTDTSGADRYKGEYSLDGERLLEWVKHMAKLALQDTHRLHNGEWFPIPTEPKDEYLNSTRKW